MSGPWAKLAAKEAAPPKPAPQPAVAPKPSAPVKGSTATKHSRQSLTGLKRATQRASASSTKTRSTPPKVSAKVEVSDKLMGVIIGKGGETIKALQSTHGVRIKYVRDTGFITLMADAQENIDAARSAVEKLVAESQSRNRRRGPPRPPRTLESDAPTPEPCVLVMQQIPDSVSQDMVEALFSAYGDVTDVKLKDLRQGRIAFVHFAEDASVDAALDGCPAEFRDKVSRRMIRPQRRGDGAGGGGWRPRHARTVRGEALELSGIPDEARKEDIEQLFLSFGALQRVTLRAPTQGAGRSAVVEFEDVASLDAAFAGAPPEYRDKLRRVPAPPGHTLRAGQRAGHAPNSGTGLLRPPRDSDQDWPQRRDGEGAPHTGGGGAARLRQRSDTRAKRQEKLEARKTEHALHVTFGALTDHPTEPVSCDELTTAFSKLGEVACVDVKSARYGFVYYAGAAAVDAALAQPPSVRGEALHVSIPTGLANKLPKS